jgi:hypothetical protein
MNVRISQELLSEVRSQITNMRVADCRLNLGQPNLDALMVVDSGCKQLSDIVWGGACSSKRPDAAQVDERYLPRV